MQHENGYIEGNKYYFYIKDHLRNNRVVADAKGEVVQRTDYYPYGMPHPNSTAEAVQPYKFGGKEYDTMHGLDMYDFEARSLGTGIPVFDRMDPLAEKYYSISPHAYCAGNPVKFVDPTGEDIYLYYYTNKNTRDGQPDPEADAMFWMAAITRATDMLNNGTIKEGDIALFGTLPDLGNLKGMVESQIASYSPTYGKTAEFGLWSHGGLDGPSGTTVTSGEYRLDNHQMTPEGWGEINFNWKDDGAKAMFFGCRTASGDNPWAQTISKNANMQNVEVYGQTKRSWPSPYTNARIPTSDIKDGNHTYPTYMVGSSKSVGTYKCNIISSYCCFSNGCI